MAWLLNKAEQFLEQMDEQANQKLKPIRGAIDRSKGVTTGTAADDYAEFDDYVEASDIAAAGSGTASTVLAAPVPASPLSATPRHGLAGHQSAGSASGLVSDDAIFSFLNDDADAPSLPASPLPPTSATQPPATPSAPPPLATVTASATASATATDLVTADDTATDTSPTADTPAPPSPPSPSPPSPSPPSPSPPPVATDPVDAAEPAAPAPREVRTSITHTATLDALRDRLQRVTEENTTLRGTLDKAKIAVRKSRQDADSHARALTAARAAHDVTEAALAQREADLASATADKAELEGRIDALTAALDKLADEKAQQAERVQAAAQDTAEAMERLREELRLRQEALDAERRKSNTGRAEAEAREQALERERSDMAEAIAQAQREAREAQRETQALTVTVGQLREQLIHEQDELRAYQTRATAVLNASKARVAELEAALREGGGAEAVASVAAATTADAPTQGQLEAVQEQVTTLTRQMESARVRHEAERTMLQSQLDDTHESLARARTRISELQRESAARLASVAAAGEEREALRAEHARALTTRDDQLRELERELAQRTAIGKDHDLQAQLDQMADHLYRKQMAVEELTADKQALSLRVQSLERRVAEQTAMASAAPAHTTVNMPGTNAAGRMAARSAGSLRFRPTASALPFLDEGDPTAGVVQRRMGRVVRIIDDATVGTFRFLYRFPIARLLVLGYAFILHLWVFVVLSHSSPNVISVQDTHIQSAGVPSSSSTPSTPSSIQ